MRALLQFELKVRFIFLLPSVKNSENLKNIFLYLQWNLFLAAPLVMRATGDIIGFKGINPLLNL